MLPMSKNHPATPYVIQSVRAYLRDKPPTSVHPAETVGRACKIHHLAAWSAFEVFAAQGYGEAIKGRKGHPSRFLRGHKSWDEVPAKAPPPPASGPKLVPAPSLPTRAEKSGDGDWFKQASRLLNDGELPRGVTADMVYAVSQMFVAMAARMRDLEREAKAKIG